MKHFCRCIYFNVTSQVLELPHVQQLQLPHFHRSRWNVWKLLAEIHLGSQENYA
jgi:hypothetical protein